MSGPDLQSQQEASQPRRLKRFCDVLRVRLQQMGRDTTNVNILQPSVLPRLAPLGVAGSQCTSHHPLDLAVATIEALRAMPSSLRQQQGVLDYLNWVEHHMEQPVTFADDRTCWTKEHVVELLDALSKLLFHEHDFPFGPSTHVQFFENLHAMTGYMGQTSHLWTRREDDGELQLTTKVIIDPGDHTVELHLSDPAAATVSVILHELIHAYLYANCCDGNHTRAGQCTRNGGLLWPTGSGHNVAWFHLACQIELCMNISPAFRVNIGAFPVLVNDYESGGVRMLAQEWKCFFVNTSWLEACDLFDWLHVEQENSLCGYCILDPLVMQVFAEEGEKAPE